jgi:hypothetical protein
LAYRCDGLAPLADVRLAHLLDRTVPLPVVHAVVYRRARPPKPPRLAVGSRFWPTPWTRTLRLGSGRQWHADDDAGVRNYLVLAKPNVIMNDIRLRGLAVAGSDAAK